VPVGLTPTTNVTPANGLRWHQAYARCLGTVGAEVIEG
jgi:hypothetical protein